jgi:hypothetical protein
VYYTKIYRIPVMVIRRSALVLSPAVAAFSNFTEYPASGISCLTSSFNLPLVESVVNLN